MFYFTKYVHRALNYFVSFALNVFRVPNINALAVSVELPEFE